MVTNGNKSYLLHLNTCWGAPRFRQLHFYLSPTVVTCDLCNKCNRHSSTCTSCWCDQSPCCHHTALYYLFNVPLHFWLTTAQQLLKFIFVLYFLNLSLYIRCYISQTLCLLSFWGSFFSPQSPKCCSLWELLGFSIMFKVWTFYVKCLEIMYIMIWRYTNKIELNWIPTGDFVSLGWKDAFVCHIWRSLRKETAQSHCCDAISLLRMQALKWDKTSSSNKV